MRPRPSGPSSLRGSDLPASLDPPSRTCTLRIAAGRGGHLWTPAVGKDLQGPDPDRELRLRQSTGRKAQLGNDLLIAGLADGSDRSS